MTSTVNSPCWRTMSCSHSSNSVRSEIDNGDLGHVLVEQDVERLAVRAFEPGLELLELGVDSNGGAGLLAAGTLPDGAAERGELIEDGGVRLALLGPAQF